MALAVTVPSVSKILLLTTLFTLTINVSGEYFTSTNELQKLLHLEVHLVDIFAQYADYLQETHKQIENAIDEALDNKAQLVNNSNNPLSAFKIIKDFAVHWKNVEDFVFAETYSHNLSSFAAAKNYTMTTEEDLAGAVNGIVLLQKTYGLNTHDVAAGLLMGVKYAKPLAASDCYWLGRHLFDAKEYRYAAEWFTHARIRLEQELSAADKSHVFAAVSLEQILTYMAPAYFHLNNIMASTLYQELLRINPNSYNATENKLIYEQAAYGVRRSGARLKLKSQQSPLEVLREKICRGSLTQTPREQRALRCRYATNNIPYCLLAPFKMEELNHDPRIAYYHEAIYDNEIAYILSTGQDHLQRSGISAEGIYSDIRTSQQTWLYPAQHTQLSKFAQRLEDITGLTLETAEPLQLANYGVGGHYGPHFDFMESAEKFYSELDNRLVTAMFNLNDVKLGGATAFPFLRLAARPIRRSVLVWYNLHESLELDYRTKHVGCPVLVGSKWILNEWFHVQGQMFRKPCGLVQNGNISLIYEKFE